MWARRFAPLPPYGIKTDTWIAIKHPPARSTTMKSRASRASPGNGGMRAGRWRRCTSLIRCVSPISVTAPLPISVAIRNGSTALRGCACSISVAGGGILSEPLARLGAAVTGADPSESNIAVARQHAAQSGLAVDYRSTTAEALAQARETFDVVLAMEVIEHVADVGLFIGLAAAMVKPGGLNVCRHRSTAP